jgi:hypothetical protein
MLPSIPCALQTVIGTSARRYSNRNLNPFRDPAHSVRCSRTFTHFAHTRKVLPLPLSALRAKDDKTSSKGAAVLRMLVFGKPGVGKVRR